MDRRRAYFQFAEKYPELFVNPPADGITILMKEDEINKVEQEEGQSLIKQGLPAEWGHVGMVFRDQYSIILRDAVRFPDGRLGTYTRFTAAAQGVPGVVVLPRYQDRILVIRLFRHATRAWHIELPRGFGEPGLTSEECALKELREEIGASVKKPLISLGQLHPNTGGSTDATLLYYAEIATYGLPEKAEAIKEIIPISIENLEAMIRDELITDGFTLAAYTRAKLKGLLSTP